MKKYLNKKSAEIVFTIGIVIVLLSFLPFLLLGKNAVIPIHDQLDGEIFTYILHAKHLFAKNFPEFMNGMPSSSLMMASLASVQFYLFTDSFCAFLINYLFVLLVAYIGMFLCTQEIWGKSWISFLVAVLFSQLPFYFVYGLSVMGQPLLVWTGVRIYRQKNTVWNYFVIFLFGMFSSLVLVGYADCLILIVFTCILYVCHHPAKKCALRAVLLLLLIYIILNSSMLFELLFSPTVSHRTERVVSALPFKNSFQELFLEGQYHAASLHKMIFVFAVICFFVCLLLYDNLTKEQKKYLGGYGVNCIRYCYCAILCVLLLESCC